MTEKKKQRITIHMSKDVINRAKNAVYWTPGMTFSELADTAMTKVVDSMEKKRGEPFAQRKSAIKTGRPMKYE